MTSLFQARRKPKRVARDDREPAQEEDNGGKFVWHKPQSSNKSDVALQLAGS